MKREGIKDVYVVMIIAGVLWLCISSLPILTYYSNDPNNFLGQNCEVTAQNLVTAKMIFGISCSALFIGIIGLFTTKIRKPG